jgi:hypothetical protein
LYVVEAARPVMVCVVRLLLQRYVYVGPVPPVPVAVAVPSVVQITGEDVVVTETEVGSLSNTDVAVEQPPLDTVTV